MPYYDVANLVTVTKMNMIRRNALWLCKNHCCENTASSLPQSCERRSGLGRSQSIPQSCAAVSASLEVSRRSVQRSQELQNLTILDGASWMHLHNCRCFQEHLRMLLESLRALCLAPGGSGSIWRYLEALVRSPGVSGRIASGFRTELYFADVRGCRYTKLIDSRYRYNRYRYHKNAIINKDISPLVGIELLSLLELILFIP